MPQDSENTARDLIQAPESPWLSLNNENLGSNAWPENSPAAGEAITIDQGNSHTEFDSSQSQNLAFLDGTTDVIPKLPPIPFPEVPDLIRKSVPEFIDDVRQWLRDPQRPECDYGYHEFCCQLGAPDPKMGPKGRDTDELSKRRRKCSLCTRKIRPFLIDPSPPPNHRPACRSNMGAFFRVYQSTGMLFSRRRLLLFLYRRGTYNPHRV